MEGITVRECIMVKKCIIVREGIIVRECILARECIMVGECITVMEGITVRECIMVRKCIIVREVIMFRECLLAGECIMVRRISWSGNVSRSGSLSPSGRVSWSGLLPDGTKPSPEPIVGFSLVRFCGIHLKTISQWVPKLPFCKMNFENCTFKITATSFQWQWVELNICKILAVFVNMHFLRKTLFCCDSNFTSFYFWWSIWQYLITGTIIPYGLAHGQKTCQIWHKSGPGISLKMRDGFSPFKVLWTCLDL